jgi:hypothetical protein
MRLLLKISGLLSGFRSRRRKEAETPEDQQASASLRRRLRILSAALVLFAFTLTPLLVAAAQHPQTNAASLNVALVRGFPGVISQVPISLVSTGTLVAAQFDLSYPLNHLAPGTISPGTFGADAIVRWREISPGIQRYLIYSQSSSPLQTNGLIGTLPVAVPTNETKGGPLSVSNFVSSTAAARLALPMQTTSGGVLVGPVFRADDGIVYLMFSAQSNQTYVVQATTNFVNWVTISTNLAVLNYFTLADMDAPRFSYRFYRAVPQSGIQTWLINNPMVVTNGSIRFQVSGPSGTVFIVQASTDLVNWSGISTNTARAAPLLITDPAAGQFSRRFYRVFAVP